MDQDLNQRFEIVARAKLAVLTDVYRRLEAEPPVTGDRALYQRTSTGKALLSHIALLRKLLHLDGPGSAAAPSGVLDLGGYQALVAELNDAEPADTDRDETDREETPHD